MREILWLLHDILEAMEAAEEMIVGYDFPRFVSDLKTKLAVTRAFEIMGEAVRNLPADFFEQYPAVPWRDMISMRNRLAHAYFETDYSLMWRAIHEVFPKVKPAIAAMIAEREAQ